MDRCDTFLHIPRGQVGEVHVDAPDGCVDVQVLLGALLDKEDEERILKKMEEKKKKKISP